MNAEAETKTFGVISNGAQAIATEIADYSKKSLEEGTKVFEQLCGTKSLEKAIEVQQGYFKTAYEGFVAHQDRRTLCRPRQRNLQAVRRLCSQDHASEVARRRD